MVLGGLAAVLLAVLGDLLFAGGTRMLGAEGSDLAMQFVAWREFGFGELARGNLALWNPHIYGGAPYFGGMQSALLYPPNWLFLVLPLPQAMNWSAAINAWLLGAFTAGWALRRGLHPLAAFVSGALLMFSGPYYAHAYAGHVANLATMTWVPLLFLALDDWMSTRRVGACLCPAGGWRGGERRFRQLGFYAAYALSYGSKDILLVLAFVVTNPHWIIAASTSDDVPYGLALFLVGLWLLTQRLPVMAAIVLAITGGVRLAYAPLGLFLLVFLWWRDREQRGQYAQALAVYAIVGILLYLPVFIHSKLTLAFLTPSHTKIQDFSGLALRAVYKTGRLFGYLGTAMLLLIVWLLWRERTDGRKTQPLIPGIAWLIIIWHLLVFLRVPTEVNQLIACVPVAGVLLVYHGATARHIAPLVVMQVIYWFVAVEPLQIAHLNTGHCGRVVAISAQFAPHLEPGVLAAAADGIKSLEPCYVRALRITPTDLRSPLPPPIR